MLRFSASSLLLVMLAACGGARATSSHDTTTVRVIRPGDPEPTVQEELTFPKASPPAQVAVAPIMRRRLEVAPRIQSAAITEWGVRYPAAADGLRDWVKAHPEAAALLARADVTDSERVESLTEWAITNPAGKLETFVATENGWDFVRPILQHHDREGLDAYLEWCRRSPHAALELTHHGHGLAWAATHLYAHELGARASILDTSSPSP